MWAAVDAALDEIEEVIEQPSSPSMKQHREYMKRARDEQIASMKLAEPPEYKDYYQILGLEREANAEQIRAAYLALARQRHPDRIKGSQGIADKDWALIPSAYAALSDTQSKREYDEDMPLRDALVAFYQLHNPTKLSSETIETTIENWQGKELDLFECLNSKYEIKAYEGQEIDYDVADIKLMEKRDMLPKKSCCARCLQYVCCCCLWVSMCCCGNKANKQYESVPHMSGEDSEMETDIEIELTNQNIAEEVDDLLKADAFQIDEAILHSDEEDLSTTNLEDIDIDEELRIDGLD